MLLPVSLLFVIAVTSVFVKHGCAYPLRATTETNTAIKGAWKEVATIQENLKALTALPAMVLEGEPVVDGEQIARDLNGEVQDVTWHANDESFVDSVGGHYGPKPDIAHFLPQLGFLVDSVLKSSNDLTCTLNYANGQGLSEEGEKASLSILKWADRTAGAGVPFKALVEACNSVAESPCMPFQATSISSALPSPKTSISKRHRFPIDFLRRTPVHFLRRTPVHALSSPKKTHIDIQSNGKVTTTIPSAWTIQDLAHLVEVEAGTASAVTATVVITGQLLCGGELSVTSRTLKFSRVNT